MAKYESSFIDFRKLFKTYINHWYLFVISIIGCLAVGFVATRVFTQKYGIRANIMIREEEKSPLASMSSIGDIFGTSSSVDDEIYVISSHSLYKDVIEELGINQMHYVKHGFLNTQISYPTFPLTVTYDPAVVDTLSVVLNFKIKVNEDGLTDVKLYGKKKKLIEEIENAQLPYTFKTVYGDFTLVKTKDFPIGEEVRSNISLSGLHGSAEAIAEQISSDIASKKSRAIELAIDSKNAVLGTDILSTLIKKYNERGIKEDNIERQKTAQFIEERLNSLGKELSDAEVEIQTFKEKHGLVDVVAEVTYQQTKKGQIEKELIEAETNLEVLRLTREFVDNPANAYELVPTVVDNQALNAFIKDYNEKLVERNNMLRNVSPNNEAVINITTSIDAARQGIKTSINQAYGNALAVVNDLKKQVESTNSSLNNIPEAERLYVDMDRERRLKSEIYLYLLGRQEENSMMIANASPKGIIIDAPYTLAKPIGPSAKVILIVFFLLGLVLPPIYLYLVKLIRNKFDSREDVERRISAPILGEMSLDRSGKPLIVSSDSTSSANELFRLMRANLLFVLNDNKDKVVMLTSTTSGEGKSFISINLAATLSLLGKKVILVGMDIRAPKLSSYLGITSQYGLTQYLSNSDISLDSIIIKHPLKSVPTLDVILAGPIPPNPAELLVSSKVDEMFAKLRESYDYIIVDTAPVGMVSDTFTLDRIADATIYVTRANFSSNNDLDFIEDVYQGSRLKKLSVVINGVKSKKSYGYRTQKGALDH